MSEESAGTGTGVDHGAGTAPPHPDAPGGAAAPLDRAAALAEGAPGIPRAFWYWALGAVLVLGLGGVVLERLASSAHLNPVAPPTTVAASPPTLPAAPSPLAAGARSLTAFMGLRAAGGRAAPPLDLVDQHGHALSLASLRGRTVVLSFFDGRCNDICPVLGAELRAADTALGPAAARVTFLTVNTDPRATAVSGLVAAGSVTGLAAEPNWYMVTGALDQLDAVWRAYGVTVNYEPSTGAVAHTDVLYFVSPSGALRYRATPFADESRTGAEHLPALEEQRWAQGIAAFAQRAGTGTGTGGGGGADSGNTT